MEGTGATAAEVIPYRVDPPPGSRTRRKCVRCSMGSARRRRICSRSARSVS